MKPTLAVVFLPLLLVGGMQWIFAPCAAADSLSIVYNVNQNQTAAVELTTFAVVTLTGSVINNTDAAISFQLTGGPVPFEPFVASFQNGIGFPGTTLGPHASTGIINLAVVALQPFDPALSYPGSVKIVLQAIVPGTGTAFTENDASIEVLGPARAVAEPEVPLLLAAALLAVAVIVRSKNSASAC
jgi:hypothetical protein